MSESIVELVNELPQRNMTTMMLNCLDFVVPGQWSNITDFEKMITEITGEDDPALIQQIRDRAIVLYSDKHEGYQRAMWLYETVDTADKALGTAALANKVSEKVSLLGFLNKVTPSADKAQSIDLAIKLVVEIVAYCQINGLPGDSLSDFMAAVSDYGGAEIMRLAALVSVDGLLPLGPDFLGKVHDTIHGLSSSELAHSEAFKRIGDFIPGSGAGGKLDFINHSFDSMQGWMEHFVQERQLTPDRVMDNISKAIDIADNKLDYVAAFIDVTTNYYEHTGTQTIARCLIDRAYGEI